MPRAELPVPDNTTPACDAFEFGLPPIAVEGLRGVMLKHPRVRRAVIYGSRAKGNYRPGSDIDLALDAPDLPFAELLQIEQEIDDLLLPYETDLALLAQIESPPLREHIARVGKTLWETR